MTKEDKIKVIIDRLKKHNLYKVKLFTNYFEVPTSCATENIISYVCITAENVSTVKDKVDKMFKGRKEIMKIEKYDHENKVWNEVSGNK